MLALSKHARFHLDGAPPNVFEHAQPFHGKGWDTAGQGLLYACPLECFYLLRVNRANPGFAVANPDAVQSCKVRVILRGQPRTSMPFLPRRTWDAKKGSSVRCESTYAHSTTDSPPIARRHDSANFAAAYAIDSVAEPLPACTAQQHALVLWVDTSHHTVKNDLQSCCVVWLAK